MTNIRIQLIPDEAVRHTEEMCQIIVEQPDGVRTFHTIAGATGEETLLRWLEYAQALTLSTFMGG